MLAQQQRVQQDAYGSLPCNALAPVELVRPLGLPQRRGLWSNRKNTGALQYEYRKESETAHD